MTDYLDKIIFEDSILQMLCLHISDIRIFLTFVFSICKIVDIIVIYQPLNISIRTVMKNPEMLKPFSDHLSILKLKNYLIY